MPRDIFVIDDRHPEDIAMLQALYSRSPASVVTHLEKLSQTGSGKFMDQYYVGYGHASIGDCGATTCFIEQVSMLAAKAIQDSPLYNGQEASTRYLDFSRQAAVDPYSHPAAKAVQDKWMELYSSVLPRLAEAMAERYPFDPAAYKSEKIWKNAVQARAFDVARGLLPIGATTLLSWSTTLRHARDHLRRLKHHPLPELRAVSAEIFAKLMERYPHSFRADDMDAAAALSSPREAYLAANAETSHYLSADDALARHAATTGEIESLRQGGIIVRRDAVDVEGVNRWEKPVLASRPQGAPLPWRMESYGRYNLLFLLDFGSFRDLQRHRNGVCRMPLVDSRFGMHGWYAEQLRAFLPSPVFASLSEEMEAQYRRISETAAAVGGQSSPLLDQYLFPMGTSALVHVAYSVPEMVYVAELRSAKTVHPSLRTIAQGMAKILKADFPAMALHADMDEESWTAKRGEHDIVSAA